MVVSHSMWKEMEIKFSQCTLVGPQYKSKVLQAVNVVRSSHLTIWEWVSFGDGRVIHDISPGDHSTMKPAQKKDASYAAKSSYNNQISALAQSWIKTQIYMYIYIPTIFIYIYIHIYLCESVCLMRIIKGSFSMHIYIQLVNSYEFIFVLIRTENNKVIQQ